MYHELSQTVEANFSCKNEWKKWSIALVWAGGGKVLRKSHPDCSLKVL